MLLCCLDYLSQHLKHFVSSLIKYYDENSRRDDVDTITTRKLLLPHINSFLQLIEKDDQTREVHMVYKIIICDQIYYKNPSRAIVVVHF